MQQLVLGPGPKVQGSLALAASLIPVLCRPIFAAAPVAAGGLGLPTSALSVPLVAGGIAFIVVSLGGEIVAHVRNCSLAGSRIRLPWASAYHQPAHALSALALCVAAASSSGRGSMRAAAALSLSHRRSEVVQAWRSCRTGWATGAQRSWAICCSSPVLRCLSSPAYFLGPLSWLS